MRSKKEHRHIFRHSHILILAALALGIFLAGLCVEYCPASAAGTLFGIINIPQNNSTYEVGVTIPVQLYIRTDSPKYEIYIFAKYNATPDTRPGSEDQIHHEVLTGSPNASKTTLKLELVGRYTLMAFLTDGVNKYVSRPTTINVVSSAPPSQPQSNTPAGNKSNNSPPSTIGDSDSTGPGGAVAAEGGEKEFISYPAPANTPFTIPFHRPETHGVEKITIISPSPTNPNAWIVDPHNHTGSNPDGHTYRFIELMHTNPLSDEKIKFKIEFQVPRAWLYDYAFSPSNIHMQRFADGKWEPIPTHITQLENGTIHYFGETDGIYPLAIVGNQDACTPFSCVFNPFGILDWFTLRNG